MHALVVTLMVLAAQTELPESQPDPADHAEPASADAELAGHAAPGGQPDVARHVALGSVMAQTMALGGLIVGAVAAVSVVAAASAYGAWDFWRRGAFVSPELTYSAQMAPVIGAITLGIVALPAGAAALVLVGGLADMVAFTLGAWFPRRALGLRAMWPAGAALGVALLGGALTLLTGAVVMVLAALAVRPTCDTFSGESCASQMTWKVPLALGLAGVIALLAVGLLGVPVLILLQPVRLGLFAVLRGVEVARERPAE